MSSREAILQRIRSALSEHPTPDVPAAMPPAPEVWPTEKPTTEAMIERFTAELAAVYGEVVRCASMEHARVKLVEMMEAENWPRLGAMDRPLCRELAATLDGKVAWADGEGTAPTMADLPVGLIAAEALLADTGSSMIVPRTTAERLLCYLPPACVIVATTEMLVEHLPAAWEQVAAYTGAPETRGETVFITGPSRTADIEKILILGVHGPKRLVVLLIG